MIDLMCHIKQYSKNDINVYVPDKSTNNIKPFMSEFYKQVNYVRNNLFELNQMIETLQKLQNDLFSNQNNKTSSLNNDIDIIFYDLYHKLEKIKLYNTNNYTEKRIVCNIHTALFYSFSNLRQYHNELQTQYEKHNKTIKNIYINYSDSNIDNSLQFQLLNTHTKLELATDTYNYVQARHKDILNLENSVHEVNQLFLDMISLVDIQGETINRITYNISTACDHCRDAKETLVDVHMVKENKTRSIAKCFKIFTHF
jgi:t-SNARE complex subunit (syntaxin)